MRKILALFVVLFVAGMVGWQFARERGPQALKTEQRTLEAAMTTVEIQGTRYTASDLGKFTPSSAIYFMNGFSEATVQILATGATMTFRFTDQSTSIAASVPIAYDRERMQLGVLVPVPPPLTPLAFLPADTPERYQRSTMVHMMQVVSMNMRDEVSGSRLLIGLPYLESYPELFFEDGLFGDGVKDAASYGMVQSLTEFDDKPINGYPARSFFAIYHVIETPMGVFFNKKATQMELQPNREGKLALALPPIPFMYELINGPIPLYDVKDPKGAPVAIVVRAAHGSHADDMSVKLSPETWPLHTPDLKRLQLKLPRRWSSYSAW